jgi:hypothetical protein
MEKKAWKRENRYGFRILSHNVALGHIKDYK